MNGCDGYKGRRIDRVHSAWMCSRKAARLQRDPLRELTRRSHKAHAKLSAREKTDFLALAMMQTEVSGASARTKRQTFPVPRAWRCQFLSRSMIECSSMTPSRHKFPTQCFASKIFHFSGVLLAGRLAGAFRIVHGTDFRSISRIDGVRGEVCR